MKVRKIEETFWRNFPKISQIPKIREKFPRKFPENFPENFPKIPGVFFGEMHCYRAKIYLCMFIKGRKIGENFGENFREISQIPKIRENFPGKFPENSRKIPGKSGGFLRQNAMIQSENRVFYH